MATKHTRNTTRNKITGKPRARTGTKPTISTLKANPPSRPTITPFTPSTPSDPNEENRWFLHLNLTHTLGKTRSGKIVGFNSNIIDWTEADHQDAFKLITDRLLNLNSLAGPNLCNTPDFFALEHPLIELADLHQRYRWPQEKAA
jgi:hypothetical protein